ncbi:MULTISPECIES: NRAMP family divalent metal transporter [Gammaproteobacteria]|uniref:NRAMP family divalent metal transporter n=1 Tax=Gammaproteobacteria TaxID=1236 RepID=UPI000DCF6881|nr:MULTISPECIES: divalent metal cation transporter [Gammaproteobacteria]RTE86560.1 divalent metal cation transporter [Aliidiomarina sp. B3213]TCZ90885.1 divalent metal cation transporter [Lysobacter sp. N42]
MHTSRLKALGPGLLLATAAIGGSHLVASTQAGALFGWQLLWVIIAVNALKYPFFRFAVHYTATQEQSLITGYRNSGKGLYGAFIVVCSIAAIVATAGVLLLTASLLQYFVSWILPSPPSVISLSLFLLVVSWVLLIWGRYPALDKSAKIFMLLLALATLAAFIIAWSKGAARVDDFVSPNPWQLASFGFLIAMMGWMPAPIEISVINSLWAKEKYTYQPEAKKYALFDFNLGYWVTAGLAVLFLGLGAIIQYGSTTEVALAGGAFAQQLIDMYAQTMGEWSRWLVAFIAFVCMFGTTITVLDGYARIFDACFHESRQTRSKLRFNALLIAQGLLGLLIIIFFAGALRPMLTFAMGLAFVTTPLFAWLNMRLAKEAGLMNRPLKVWSIMGLSYLIIFVFLYLIWLLM